MTAVSLSQRITNLPKATCKRHEKLWCSNSVRGDLLRKQWGTGLTDPMSTRRRMFSRKCRFIPTMLLPEGSRHCSAELLFISMGYFEGGIEEGGKCLPFAPWEPNRVPVPRHSLGPIHWVDPDAAGVWMGTADEREGCTAALIDRGQDEDGIHISWLQPPSSLLFISLLCSYSAPSILSGFLLMPAMFYVVCRDGVGLHGEPTVLSFKSGSLPHLCWAFNELFYS